jgi:hypothetical protein
LPKMTITGADGRLDGEYEVTMPPWTKREWYLVKRQCNVIASDFTPNEDGTTSLDMNLLTAIGIVALHRAGRDALIPIFWETADDQVEFDFSDLEELAEGNPPGTETDPATASSPESSAHSGNGSSSDGASSADLPSPTGTPLSVASSRSDPEISAT